MAVLSIHDALKKYWGYDSFRPLQEDIIQHTISGKNGMALLPTGGGKSICFQVPAVTMEGITIVISPLIALMKDQVEHLRHRGIVAEAIYSGMSKRDIDRIFDNCVYGDIKLLYLSPERLQTDMAEARIKKMNVSLVAIDEAHCISQWGHDFRPSYLDIAKIREWQPNAPFLALTATATAKVRSEILEYLNMPSAQTFEKSFARNNLNYLVFKVEDKLGKMKHILTQTFGSAIVYVRNRRKTKEISEWLARNNISAAAYHAGLSMTQRNEVQKSWIENGIRVMVATNAFGMGIDKPDVRTVIHYGPAPSLEEYYQEAGRAGRDGQTGYCALLYHPSDITQQMEMNAVRFPSMPEIRRVYKALQLSAQLAPGTGKGVTTDFKITPFCEKYKLSVASTFHALKILEQDGWLILSDSIHTPSRAKIVVGKQTLYEFQLQNKALEKVISLLMRGFEGIIQDHVRINENTLAQRLGVGADTVKGQLNRLHKMNIIDYKPASDVPKIIMLQDRTPDKNLTIDEKRYQNRKDRIYQQMESIVHYLDATGCRENFLLNYFGESKTEECGHCDLCRKRKQQQMPSKEDLLNQIPENGIKVKQLVNKYSSVHEMYVKKLLQFLEGERIIKIEHNLVFLKKGKKSD